MEVVEALQHEECTNGMRGNELQIFSFTVWVLMKKMSDVMLAQGSDVMDVVHSQLLDCSSDWVCVLQHK